ncbi:hypothetical protein, partial [Burkholderia multivorans]|uniref:hypothetical protein n=1 Tax=Burkholderia multivorans TaxID=87883 RepID=UPI001C613FFC
NSYVNLKIATCLVRYADDRLIDQRFPKEREKPADIFPRDRPKYQDDRTTRPTDEGHTAGEAVYLTRT